MLVVQIKEGDGVKIGESMIVFKEMVGEKSIRLAIQADKKLIVSRRVKVRGGECAKDARDNQ